MRLYLAQSHQWINSDCLKMCRSHNPSYLWLLRTSAERTADPGSIAARANAEGEKADTSMIQNETLSPKEGEHCHAIRTLVISTIKANRFKNCAEANRCQGTFSDVINACTAGRCNRQSEFTLLHFTIFQ